MSYCRWSTNDYMCDLYVYESADGFETHVAARRYADAVRALLPSPLKTAGLDMVDVAGAIVARHLAVGDLLEQHEIEPIGLPHDGESFYDDDPAACADRVEMLAKLGYRVPDFVAESLRDE